MSKKDKPVNVPGEVVDMAPPPSMAMVPPPQEKLIEQDRMTLDLAKARRGTAEAQAKEALAKNETAELAYRYIVLQLYMKYGLTAADAITEAGEIIRGGALAQNQPPQGQQR